MSDMQIKHEKELEVNNQNNVKQITALRMELQRAVELRNQKVQQQRLHPKFFHKRHLWALSAMMWNKVTLGKLLVFE